MPTPRIASGDYEVGLDPADGGGVIFLRHRGVDVLRPAPQVRAGPLDLSCFALVPYANRIAHGRFVWDAREVLIAPNMKGDASPMHGDGWLSAWSVAQVADDRIVLELRHAAGAWPWSYLARQTIHADPRGVSFELELTNLSAEAMPAGLGYHPYFPARADARLRADVRGVWLTGSTAKKLSPGGEKTCSQCRLPVALIRTVSPRSASVISAAPDQPVWQLSIRVGEASGAPAAQSPKVSAGARRVGRSSLSVSQTPLTSARRRASARPGK